MVDAVEEEEFDTLMNVNAKAQLMFIKEALPLVKQSKSDPNILVNASLYGKAADKYVTPYAMSKAAVINMVRCLNLELIT